MAILHDVTKRVLVVDSLEDFEKIKFFNEFIDRRNRIFKYEVKDGLYHIELIDRAGSYYRKEGIID